MMKNKDCDKREVSLAGTISEWNTLGALLHFTDKTLFPAFMIDH
jgi:hypothetical protein